jgi:hypothetical protein
MIKEAGLKTETLLERMLHELVFFSETRKHLDVNNLTFCCGSRYADGYGPGRELVRRRVQSVLERYGRSWRRLAVP